MLIPALRVHEASPPSWHSVRWHFSAWHFLRIPPAMVHPTRPVDRCSRRARSGVSTLVIELDVDRETTPRRSGLGSWSDCVVNRLHIQLATAIIAGDAVDLELNNNVVSAVINKHIIDTINPARKSWRGIRGSNSTYLQCRSNNNNNKSSSGDEIPERDVMYRLIWLLIYHWTTTHLYFRNIF